MYKNTIPPKIQPIQQPPFNQQKMVLNGPRRNSNQNGAIQQNVNGNGIQNGNEKNDNPFMSKVGNRRKREENTSNRTHTAKHAATRLLTPLRYQTQLASEPTAIAC